LARLSKGLATVIMNKFFKKILDEGKTKCLFYDIPAAGPFTRSWAFKKFACGQCIADGAEVIRL